MEGTSVLGTANVNGNGMATLMAPFSAAGQHQITALYSGDSSFAASESQVASVQINNPVDPAVVDGPKVTVVQRYGFHHQSTYIVLDFSGPLDSTSAQLLSNYSLAGPIVRPWHGGNPIKIGSASYNPSTYTVTLAIAQKWNVHWTFQLTINGSTPLGVASISGTLLDGAGDGRSGTNFVTTITRKNLAGRASKLPGATLVRSHQNHKAKVAKPAR
jgi:hypothetical protein